MSEQAIPSPAPVRPVNPTPYLLAVIALTLLVFGRCVTHEFLAWDDRPMVSAHEILNPPSWEHVATVWKKSTIGLYTPLAYTLWSAVAYASRVETPDADGVTLNPMIFHLLNLLLHLAVVAVAFAILRQLVRRIVRGAPEPQQLLAAAIGTAVFAIHPLQTEAVAWIAGMNNLLAGVFALGCVLAYIRFATADRAAWRPYAISVLLLVLGLLSKPTAIVTPLIIVAIDLLLLNRPIKRVAIAVLPLVLVVVPFVIAGRAAQPAADVYAPGLGHRILLVGDTTGFYVLKLFWPWPLLMDYSRSPRWFMAHFGSTAVWIALAAAAALVALNVRRRWVLGGAAIFVAGFAPVSGLVPFNYQEFSTVADRYVYLSLLGPAVLAAILIARFGRPANIIGVAVVAVLSVVAFVQAGYWKDTFTISHHTLKYNDRSMAALNSVAFAYRHAGDEATAEAYYRTALKVHPRDIFANFNFGNLLLKQKRFDEAIACYRVAQYERFDDPRLFSNLGQALLQSGRVDESIALLEEILRDTPDIAMARTVLGYGYLEKSRPADAERQFREALRLESDNTMAMLGLRRLRGEAVPLPAPPP